MAKQPPHLFKVGTALLNAEMKLRTWLVRMKRRRESNADTYSMIEVMAAEMSDRLRKLHYTRHQSEVPTPRDEAGFDDLMVDYTGLGEMSPIAYEMMLSTQALVGAKFELEMEALRYTKKYAFKIYSDYAMAKSLRTLHAHVVKFVNMID